MTLIEFLAARGDPASVIARLDLVEYRDWLVMITAVGGRTVVPIIGQSQARVEQDLLTTRVVVTDRDSPTGLRSFNLVARDQALPPAAPPAAPTTTPATAPASTEGGGSWDKFVDLLSPEAKRQIDSAPSAERPLAEPKPAARTIPSPSTAEDGDALAEITAASAKIAAQAAGVLDLPSPPPILLDGLIADLGRQRDNFAMQAQMVTRRTDLAAFPVKLDAVLAEIDYLMRRATALRRHPAAPPPVDRPATRPAVPAVQPVVQPPAQLSPRAVAQSAEMWRQLTIPAPGDARRMPAAAPAHPAPDYAAQAAAAATTAKANAAAMKAQKDQFDEWQAAHKRQTDAFDKANVEWASRHKR